jgi:hypothetical protein
MIVGNPLFPLPTSYYGVSKLADQLDLLSNQLTTGQKATTLADLGSVRFTDLTVRARLARLTGYDSNIGTVNMRIGLMNQVMTAVTTVNTQTLSGQTPGTYGSSLINFTTAATTASNSLSQVLTSLNTDLNGHYLFGGSTVDTPPVAPVDAIMNGADGKDGFVTVAQERLEADQGVDNMGRLSLFSPPSTTVTAASGTAQLTLQDASSPGATLLGVSFTAGATSTGSVVATPASGATGQAAFSFTDGSTLPQAGDQLGIDLKLRDGTTTSVTLSAVASTATPGPGEFKVGATAAETAANAQAAFNQYMQSQGVGAPNDLGSSISGPTVTVTGAPQNSAAIPGMTLATTPMTTNTSGSPPGITVSGAQVTFNGNTQDGDTVSVSVMLPGSSTPRTITLSAIAQHVPTAADGYDPATAVSTQADAGPGQFVIGATPEETAANFQTALSQQLGGTVTLGEDSPDTSPFGMKLDNISSSNAAVISTTGPSGAPSKQLSVSFLGTPSAGDTVSIRVKLPDGTFDTMTLKAVSATDNEVNGVATVRPGEFLIGSTAAETTANFQNSLKLSIQHETQSTLTAASNFAAASDFFGSAGDAAERLSNDQGSDLMGHLNLDPVPTGSTVGLAEDGQSLYGLKFAATGTTTSNATAIDVTGPAGAPAGVSVSFNAQPAAGDTVTLAMTLPDGTAYNMTLTATNGPSVGPNQFLIGSSTADTAANFRNSLSDTIKGVTQGPMVAASDNIAAAPRRVDAGTGSLATATGYTLAATAKNETVQWYVGGNADQVNARGAVSTKVDDSTSVNYGVQANEYGFTQLIRTLAVQAVSSYAAGDSVAQGDNISTTELSKQHYDAVASRVQANLSTIHDSQQGSLAAIGVDLGLTQTTLKAVSDRHTAYGAQLQDVVANNEQADPNEVASQLLDLQTRLSASYSAIAMISQLQLANYLR